MDTKGLKGILEKHASDYMHAQFNDIVQQRHYEKTILDQAIKEIQELCGKLVEPTTGSDYELDLIKALHSIVDRIPKGLRIDTLDFMKEVEAYLQNRKLSTPRLMDCQHEWSECVGAYRKCKKCFELQRTDTSLMEECPEVNGSPNLTGHGKIVCKKCGDVIAQCRCIENHNNIEYRICEKCSTGKKPSVREEGSRNDY